MQHKFNTLHKPMYSKSPAVFWRPGQAHNPMRFMLAPCGTLPVNLLLKQLSNWLSSYTIHRSPRWRSSNRNFTSIHQGCAYLLPVWAGPNDLPPWLLFPGSAILEVSRDCLTSSEQTVAIINQASLNCSCRSHSNQTECVPQGFTLPYSLAPRCT